MRNSMRFGWVAVGICVAGLAAPAAAQTTWTSQPATGRPAPGTSRAPATGQPAPQPAVQPPATPVPTPPSPAPDAGISERTPPAWIAMQRGHRAYLARDFDTAIAAYREAAMSTPPPPIAHYFIACAQLAKNQWGEAAESFRTASRLAGDTDAALRAKALFGIALTLEVQGQLPQAREAWLEYKTWCTTHASVPGFPTTADAHVAAIDKVTQLDRRYADVRQRIADRAAQAAEAPPVP